MFKVGDKVKYIGDAPLLPLEKWAFNNPGIIVEIGTHLLKVKYEDKYNGTNSFWFLESEIKKVTPEYIQKWEKALNV